MLHPVRMLNLLWCLWLTAFGCVTTQKLSPMQKRHITSQVIAASYDETFRATLSVLQDEDYNIKSTDMETGLIAADIEKQLNAGLKMAAILFDSLMDFGADETETTIEEGWEYHINCVITAIDDSSTQVRLTVHKVTHSTTTYSNSDMVKVEREPETIYSENVYQDLFSKIRVEAKRRQARQNGNSSTSIEERSS